MTADSAKPKKLRENLTPMQERFAQNIVAGHNLLESYRMARPDGKKDMPDLTMRKLASAMQKRPAVAARIAELRAPTIEKMGLTLADHIRSLESLRDKAEAAGKYTAAVAAQVAIGKHSGVAEAEKVSVQVTHEQWIARLSSED